MITDQKRTIRKAQGYDLGLFFNGVEYWINTSKWNEEKAKKFYKETGLKAFREGKGNKNLVFYDPKYFRSGDTILFYVGEIDKNIPQPINMSCTEYMFTDIDNLCKLDISDWNLDKVISYRGMFWGCREIVEIKLPVTINATSLDMRSMFYECKKLKAVNLDAIAPFAEVLLKYTFKDCEELYRRFGTKEDAEIRKMLTRTSDLGLLNDL